MDGHRNRLLGVVARHRVVVVVGSTALVLMLIWSGERVSEYLGHQALEHQLTTLVAASPDGAQIDLRDATSFRWDRAYVFGAYVSPDRIDERLGFKGFQPWDFVVPSNDGDQLLVFVGDSRVTGYLNLSAHDGPFTIAGTWEAGFPADQASLIAHRQPPPAGSRAWPYLSRQ